MASNERPKLSLLALSQYSETARPSSSGSASSEARRSSSSSISSLDSTSGESSSSNDTSTSSGSSQSGETKTSFYKSAHWTDDGTTIITSSYDNKICSFLIPEDLLEPRNQPLTLRPHWALHLATPTNVVATAPYYDIRIPNTDHLLVASHDHPLQLHQTLPPNRIISEDGNTPSKNAAAWQTPIASYQFTSPTTEAYYQIHSLVWPKPGMHFYVGTRDLIAQFDVTRNGDGPSTLMPTIPSRRHIRKGNGVGMRGNVSALSAQPTAGNDFTGLIAAGTWTRWVGLYDIARSGECIATWGIQTAAEGVIYSNPPADSGTSPVGIKHAVKGIGGAGINQTAWSPCGRYLLINERQSTGMLVYDVRGTNKVLGFLAGRDARTHQRMSCDVFQGLDSIGGFEVWAGALEGIVKVWKGVGNTEGCQWPSWDFSAADGAAGAQGIASPALGSVGLHYSGSVVATCAGAWSVPEEDVSPKYRARIGLNEPGDGEPSVLSPSSTAQPLWQPSKGRIEESALKLWMIGASGSPESAAAVEAPEQGDVPMSEADEVEKHRQRMLSALGTTEEDEPDPGSSLALESKCNDECHNDETAATREAHGRNNIQISSRDAIQVDESEAKNASGSRRESLL